MHIHIHIHIHIYIYIYICVYTLPVRGPPSRRPAALCPSKTNPLISNSSNNSNNNNRIKLLGFRPENLNRPPMDDYNTIIVKHSTTTVEGKLIRVVTAALRETQPADR